MADEHDAWFRDTFGLDLGQAAQGLPDAARNATVIYWKEGETLPTVESKGRVDIADLGKPWQMGGEAIKRVGKTLARDADAIPGVVDGIGRPREIAEQAAKAASGAASDAIDTVQQGVADIEAEAGRIVDAASDAASEAIDSVDQGLADMAAEALAVSDAAADAADTIEQGLAGAAAAVGAV